MRIRQRRPRAFVDAPPPSLLLQDTLNGNELYELVRMTAAFGVDGLPLDVPQEAAVRDLLETELPPWRDDDHDARGASLEDDEPEDPHGYVPRDAAVASTPKKLATPTDFALSRAQSRVSESLTSDLRHLRDDDDPASGSSPPRSPSHPPLASSPSGVGYFAESPRARAERQRRLEAEYEAVTRAMAEHGSSRSAERPSTEPRISPPPFSSPRHSVSVASLNPRVSPRPAPRSASPRRPAWGGSGADVSRFERALRRSRREGAPPKSPEERVAEKRRRERNAASARAAEEAAVARMRWARERGAKPGERAGQWRAPSAGTRDAREPPHASASVSVSASGMNPGERLYRRGMWDKARKEQRAEAVAAEMEEGMAPVGMGGRESVRARGMTNVSRMLMSDAAGFEHRQRRHEERRRETAELERLRQLERDVEEERRLGKPRITREAARMRRSVRDLNAWQERKLRRAEFLRAESEARQLAELEGMFTPRIDPRSRRIAAATALGNGDGIDDGIGDGDANGNANGNASARPVASNAGAKGAYSPRAHEREMARVLAGAALMGAAAMAHATPSPPRVARPETTSDGFPAERRALTFEDDADDEDLAGGTASEGSWSARLSPSPSPGALRVSSDAATSTIRNSVNFAVEDAPATTRASFEFANEGEGGSRAGLDAFRGFATEPSASTARARAPRHAAFDDAANAKFAPKITAKARAMQREGDVGERLHGLASAPRPKRAPRGTTAGTATAGTATGRPVSAPVTRRSAPGARERPAVPYGGWGAYQYGGGGSGGGEPPATASATGAGTRAAATVKRVPAQVPTRVPARVPTRVPSSGGAVLRAAARAKGTEPRPPEEAEARRRARAASGAAAARDEKDLGWEGLPGGESLRRSAAVARGVSWNEGYY